MTTQAPHSHADESVTQAAVRSRTRASAADIPQIRPWLLKSFVWWSQGYIRKQFHGLRISKSGLPPVVDGRPLVGYMNHPSWWDPLAGLVMVHLVYPERRHYAPIDAAALARYRIFESFGFFGIEPGTTRGAAKFLRVVESIFTQEQASLWITAQGSFTDPRQRPVELKAGLAHAARRMTRGWIVPLAVEYPFWNERCPEALFRFAAPIDVAEHRELSVEAWNALLAARLAENQDRLAEEAQSRDPSRFVAYIEGRAAIGGLYDLYRRTAAWLAGKEFHAEHDVRPSAAASLPGDAAPPAAGSIPTATGDAVKECR